MALQTGIALLDGVPMTLATRLILDIACTGVLVRGIYYRQYRRADLFLTFFSFNLSIFLITFLLNQVEMSVGAAFGLFAVFSMLRYRTENISTRDMTYLFMLIATGLIMAVSQVSFPVLLLIGAVILGTVAILESNLIARREYAQPVHYENIALIGPSCREELIADLRTRTGLDVHRIHVDEIDLLRDSARLTAYYFDDRR